MENVELEHTVVSTINYANQIAKERTIATPADYSIAGNDLAAIKTKYKELNEMRLDMTRPLDESKKRILELFRKPLAALQLAEIHIKDQMLAFSARIKAEEERKRKITTDAAGAMAVALEETFAIEITPKASGISEREIWKYEITDANLIPREWLTPDLTKIGQAVKGAKDMLKIPGVRIYSEKVLAARSY